MSTNDPFAHSPTSRTFQVLGSLWTVYGLFRLIMVICMLMYGSTATLMFGALLSRVPDPFALIAAVFSLSDIPLGTTLGIYTLIKLLPIRVAHVYERSGQTA